MYLLRFMAFLKNWIICLLLHCNSFLYSIDSSPFWSYDFQIFLFSVGCLFTFLMMLFKAQKFLALMKSNFLLLLLLGLLILYFRNLWLTKVTKIFLLCFFLQVWIVLALTFRSLVHSELIFSYDVRYGFKWLFICFLLFFMWISCGFATICCKYCSFFIVTLAENQLTIGIWVYVWALSSIALIYTSILSWCYYKWNCFLNFIFI